MHLTSWSAPSSSVIRYYINGATFSGAPYIVLKSSKATVQKATDSEIQLIKDAFVDIFEKEITKDELKLLAGKYSKSNNGSSYTVPTRNNDFGFALKSLSDFAANASNLDVSRCQFRSNVCDFYVIIDSREPVELFNIFSETEIPDISVSKLEIGDIELGCKQTGSKIIIERKTVSDFSGSILSSHAHDQAERLYEEQCNLAEQKIDAKVMWFIECNHKSSMYSALPGVNQMSGMVSYLSGILGQFVCEAYSKEHLVYLACKMLQCHVDKSLINKVASTNGNRERCERRSNLVKVDFRTKAIEEHGVNMPNRSQVELLASLPNISTKVATSIAGTGLTLAQVANLTVEALMSLDGVGKVTAEKIHAMFNYK